MRNYFCVLVVLIISSAGWASAAVPSTGRAKVKKVAVSSAGWASADQCPELIDGLFAYWKLDETLGRIAYDSVGGLDGILVGNSLWSPGPVDGAIKLDGNGDSIDLGDTGILNELDGFTISAWINISNLNKRNHIYSEGNSTMHLPRVNFYVIESSHIDNPRKLSFHVRDDAGNMAGISWDSPFPIGWHHVVAVRDGATVSLYLDGAGKSETGAYPGAMTIDGVAIGRTKVTTSNFHFNGTIDDLALFDRALTAEEIGQIYADGLEGVAIAIDPIIAAMQNIIHSIIEKEKTIEDINEAIKKERAAISELHKLHECGSGDLAPRQIRKAIMRIRQAIQRQEHLINELNKSIDDLYDALEQLGLE